MVGLSVVLEGQKAKSSTSSGGVSNKTTMVVNNVNIHSSGGSRAFSPSALPLYPRYFTQPPYLQTNFLDKCSLCNKKLLLHKDIYMYKGDNGFCSVECRYQQIMLDEDESIRKEMQCSMAAMKPTSASASSSSSSSSSSASSSKDTNGSKGAGNRASGFAY